MQAVSLGIDAFFCRSSSLKIWGYAIISSLLILFSSNFLHIDQFTVVGPLSDGAHVKPVEKELGIWSALNWSVVYLVLFPLFLVCMSRQASQIRDTIDNLTRSHVLVHSDGVITAPDVINSFLDDELKRANSVFIFLIVATAIVAIGGWITACAIPLSNYKINGEVVDWSIGTIYRDWSYLKYPLLIYTFVAYIWMCVALFAYISSIFLVFIYVIFLQNFSSGHYVIDGRSTKILSRKVLPLALGSIAYNFFIICFLGLIAAFFMSLEAAYLDSCQASITEYWFQNLKVWERANNWISGSVSASDYDWQPHGTRNQTWIMSSSVVAITFVSLSGVLWILNGTLKAARLYTFQRKEDKNLLECYGLDVTIEDEKTLGSGDELSAILPGYKTSFTLALTVVLCTLFPKLTLAFSATILAATIRYLKRFINSIGSSKASNDMPIVPSSS